MSRWTEKEMGCLRMVLERKQSSSVWEMAQQAHQKIKNRSVNAISHKLRTIIAEREFQADSVEIDGVQFPAEVISGYIIITFEDGHKEPLHHYVWKQSYGEIPSGYHVHHIDGNSLNNNKNNLALMTAQDHIQLHTAGKPPETFMLFSYLQEKGLWNDYLTYRNSVVYTVKEKE